MRGTGACHSLVQRTGKRRQGGASLLADMQRRLREARKQATSKGDVEMGDLADPLSRLRKQKERENEAFVGSQVREGD